MRKLLQIFPIALTAVVSTAAAAVDQTYTVGVEVDPLISLFSLVPGMNAIGAGAEAAMNPHVSLTVGYDSLAFSPTDKQLVEMRQERDKKDKDGALLRRMRTTSIAPGLRFHFSGGSDSFYAGGYAALAENAIEIEKESEVYKLTGSEIAPGGELGYRWKWGSGFAIRLGCHYEQVASDKSKAVRASDGKTLNEGEVRALFASDGNSSEVQNQTWRRKGRGGLDFTLGWLF
jgi:hypothetical protein